MRQIKQAAASIRVHCGEAEIGIVCGSGLGGFTDTLTDRIEMPYAHIPGFPAATVPGHAGTWCVGTAAGKRVAAMKGRFHCYEGHSPQDVVRPIRVMRELGIRTLLLTNAAGGVNESFVPGDLMVISDFLNLSGMNPLIGPNLDALGPRFPDMSRALDPQLRQCAHQTAAQMGFSLCEGIYCMMSGPTYETPAEIRLVRSLGADAVGMSTVPEIIAARHMGLRVMGISCITNMAAGILDAPLTHQEVLETGVRVQERFTALISGIIESL